MKYTRPRGTQDILPSDMPYWHTIEAASEQLFKLYNYQEIRTPMFEMTDLFTRTIGDQTDIVEKEMYTFLDKKGRSMTLRPEGTAPIARAYIENSFHQKGLSKFYYKGAMFRYERPQAGRYRQFHQMGVENIGSEHPFADAEVVSLGVHLFDELGLSDLSVSINSVGCPVCRPVIEERLKQFIQANLKVLCGDCQKRFVANPLRILDCKNQKCQTYFAGMPDIQKSHCQECRDHFNSVLEYIDSLGIIFNINPRLVRGLDYYTRTTFEIISDHLGAQNTLCGGGRYDVLIQQIGGPPTPAVGMAFGLERTVHILKSLEDKPAEMQSVYAYIAPMNERQKTKAFGMLDELRRIGIQSDMDYFQDSLKSHLKQANKLKAKYTLILGENEEETKSVSVKNMVTGEQISVPAARIISTMKKLRKQE